MLMTYSCFLRTNPDPDSDPNPNMERQSSVPPLLQLEALEQSSILVVLHYLRGLAVLLQECMRVLISMGIITGMRVSTPTGVYESAY